MFGQIYQWMQNLAFYMVMVTAVMHVVPNPEYRRYIRFFTGLVLVIMLVTPVFKFLDMGDFWQDLYHSREYQEQVKKMEEAVGSLKEIDIGEYYEENRPGDMADMEEETKSGGGMPAEEMERSESAKENGGMRTEGGDEIGVEEIRIGR